MEIQYFDLKDKKFNWKDVKEAYLRVHLPAAHSDDDLEAFISLAEAGIGKFNDFVKGKKAIRFTNCDIIFFSQIKMVTHTTKICPDEKPN